MTYWQDKVCLVTGGSAGLGLAIGQELSRHARKSCSWRVANSR